MSDLTADQREMLAYLSLRDECQKARREWAIYLVGGMYVVDVGGPGGNVRGDGATLQGAAGAALRNANLIR